MGFDITGLGSLFDFGSKLIDKLIPDPGAKLAAQQELIKITANRELAELAAETDLLKAQIQTNAEEAKSSSVLVSGWRPFVGWICGLALAYAAIIEPLARFIAAVGFSYTGTFPAIDTNLTMQVLIGMLGLGAFRTHEKVKGVS